MIKIISFIVTFTLITMSSFSQVVSIGTQVWMTKNLNVDTFLNGDVIKEAKTMAEWIKAGLNKQPAWCQYNNDPTNGIKYGKLYNWFAINDYRGLAPKGYHIPSDVEWSILYDFLDADETKVILKMKSENGWNKYITDGTKPCPNCLSWNVEYRSKVPCHTCKDSRKVPATKVSYSGNGTNSSGFSALPGGKRGTDGIFKDVGKSAYWWSSTRVTEDLAWYRYIHHNINYLVKLNVISKTEGFSVRCIKD